jgi:hypothetical protein
VTGHVVFDVTARKRNVVGGNHALATIFTASRFLAWVIARHVPPLARLLASANRMHRFGMTSRLALVAALRKALGTCLHAPTFGAEAHEVIRLADMKNFVWMTRAAKLDCIINRVLSSQYLDDLLPHSHVGVSFRVSNQVHAMLSSTEKNVDAVRSLEESNFLVVVAAHERHDDYLGFFALEIIHSR